MRASPARTYPIIKLISCITSSCLTMKERIAWKEKNLCLTFFSAKTSNDRVIEDHKRPVSSSGGKEDLLCVYYSWNIRVQIQICTNLVIHLLSTDLLSSRKMYLLVINAVAHDNSNLGMGARAKYSRYRIYLC